MHHFTKKYKNAKAKTTFDLDWEGTNSIHFVALTNKRTKPSNEAAIKVHLKACDSKNRVAIKVIIKVSHKNVVGLNYEMSYLIMPQCGKGKKSSEWSSYTFQVQPT